MKINNNQSGSLYFLASVLLFSMMELLVKLLSNDYPTGEIVFARGLFGLIPILIIIPKKNFFKNFKAISRTIKIVLRWFSCLSVVFIQLAHNVEYKDSERCELALYIVIAFSITFIKALLDRFVVQVKFN